MYRMTPLLLSLAGLLALLGASHRAMPVAIDELQTLRPMIDRNGYTGSFVLYDPQEDRWKAVHADRAEQALIPASTFKIMNALIALETGVLADEHSVIPWDSVVRPRTELNRDLTLADAFALSAVPHFQYLARTIGAERMQRYLDLVGYGNRDISGGIDQFWLTGGLRISPLQQVEFLIRLQRRQLPFATRAMGTVIRIMERQRTEQYILRGKTGWAEVPEKHNVGWFVGWVERGDRLLFFASVIEANNPGEEFASQIRYPFSS